MNVSSAESATVTYKPSASNTVFEDTLVDTQELVQPEELASTDNALWAVIFAGGIGSRFWPLSTAASPKQLLALVNERPLIAETVERLSPLIRSDRVLVVTSADIADAIHAAIPDVPRSNMLIEARPLGTAAALAWGANEVEKRAGSDAIVCAMHADLAVGYPDILRNTIHSAALLAARESHLIVLGAQPTRAETGFGYLMPGAPLSELEPLHQGGACNVDHFVEKPPAALAETMIAEGALWNTGIFVSRATVVLEQLSMHTSEVSLAFPVLESGDASRFGEMVSSISIDRGLLERSRAVAVVTCDCAWDDVGTWASLRRVRELDDTGNGTMGECHCIDSSGNVVHANGNCVVVYGLSGMLVVAIDGLTFVTTLDRASELGPLMNALPGSLRLSPGRTRS